MKFKPPSAKWPGPYGKGGNGKGKVDDEMGSGNGKGKVPRPPTSPPPLWLQEARQGKGKYKGDDENSLMMQGLEKVKKDKLEEVNMFKKSFDKEFDEKASTRASTKGFGKGLPQRLRRGGFDEKASTKGFDKELRRGLRDILGEAMTRGWEMGFAKGFDNGFAKGVDADELSYAKGVAADEFSYAKGFEKGFAKGFDKGFCLGLDEGSGNEIEPRCAMPPSANLEPAREGQ